MYKKGEITMSAFFGLLGFSGLIVGIVLIINGRKKEKKNKGGLITLLSFIVFVIALAITPTDDQPATSDNKQDVAAESETETDPVEAEKTDAETPQDETDNYKVSEGKITNNRLLINLAVRAETIVEEYDMIDNVKVDEDNITAVKVS